MNTRIKVGDVYLEIPAGTSTKFESRPELKPTSIAMPEISTSEPLDEPQYVYRPSDPFQHGVDQAHAITSIDSSHKPWVKKTWFILFVIGPLVYAELAALAMSLNGNAGERWKIFFSVNMAIAPIWLVYYSIWRRRMKKAIGQKWTS